MGFDEMRGRPVGDAGDDARIGARDAHAASASGKPRIPQNTRNRAELHKDWGRGEVRHVTENI